MSRHKEATVHTAKTGNGGTASMRTDHGNSRKDKDIGYWAHAGDHG